MTHDLVLSGCVPTVLASYLKALAIHRLVSEQLDPTATSWWDGNGQFHLASTADRPTLIAFFAEHYSTDADRHAVERGQRVLADDSDCRAPAIAKSDGRALPAYREAIDQLRGDCSGRWGSTRDRDDKAKKIAAPARRRDPGFPDEPCGVARRCRTSPEKRRATPRSSAPVATTAASTSPNNFMQRLAELLLRPLRALERPVGRMG